MKKPKPKHMILLCATCQTELARVNLPLVDVDHRIIHATKCPVDPEHRIDGLVPAK